jgi:hypothetical protein
MRASKGDWLVVEGPRLGDARREGQVVGVPHGDGSPPYQVHWLDGHEGLFFPGPDCHLLHHPPHEDAYRRVAART